MRTITLGKLTVLVSSGSTPLGGSKIYLDQGPVMLIRSQNVLMRQLSLDDVAFITDEVAGKMQRTVVETNDVLLNITGASIGRVSAFELDCQANVNQHVCIIRTIPELLNYRYLMHFLAQPSFQENINNSQHGGTRQALTFPQIRDFQIPLPPIGTQKRIAAILDQAEALRSLRRQSIGQLDALARSVFLEMFGDPVTNPKGWEWKTLGKICAEIYRYPTFYGFEYQLEGTPVARIGNIRLDGILDPDTSNYVFVDPEISKKFPRTILEMSDVVMAVRGDGSTGKRIGLVDSESLVGANISPNLLRFKAQRDIAHPLFLLSFMVSDKGQQVIDSNITRTAKKTITAEGIKKIKLPLPPLALQQEFADRIGEIEALKAQHRESLAKMDTLFASLQHRAFRGEL
jgi:type I restriction enzyme, S subunit